MNEREIERNTHNLPCVNLTFKEKKAVSALSQLCLLAANKLNHYQAAKLMYLFDREVLLETGEPAFFGRYFALPKGPIVSEVNDGIKSCYGNDVDVSIDWSEHFILNKTLHLISRREPEKELFSGLLSDEEVERLTKLFRKYENDREGRLKTDIENLPEHVTLREGERSRPMSYQFVLEKNGFTQSEIKELLEEIVYDDFYREKLDLSFK